MASSRTFVGHGIGTDMHQDPQVPNFRAAARGLQLAPGMCLAIEPMFTLGGDDGAVEPTAGSSPRSTALAPISRTPSRSPTPAGGLRPRFRPSDRGRLTPRRASYRRPQRQPATRPPRSEVTLPRGYSCVKASWTGTLRVERETPPGQEGRSKWKGPSSSRSRTRCSRSSSRMAFECSPTSA